MVKNRTKGGLVVQYKLSELASIVGGRVIGDGDLIIHCVAPIQWGSPGAISFLANSKYSKYLEQTGSSAVIVDPDLSEGHTVAVLAVKNPYAAYARIAALLHPEGKQVSGIHPSAVVDPQADIDPTASIGANVVIEEGALIGMGVCVGAGSFIGKGVRIGCDCRLAANVTIHHQCSLGERVIVHSGAVIGADGFGFAEVEGQWLKVPQLGAVTIGHDVEIGANTTIDRGALENTVIGDGVKLDNLVHIAHNVHVDDHTAIAGMSGIAGSTKVGKYCRIAGMVGISGHLEITDKVFISGKSIVTNSIKEPGAYSSGTPLDTTRAWRKNSVRFRQLDDIARRLRALEKQANNKKIEKGDVS